MLLAVLDIGNAVASPGGATDAPHAKGKTWTKAVMVADACGPLRCAGVWGADVRPAQGGSAPNHNPI